MVYKVYTDGSVKKQDMMGFSFVIVTSDKFITMKQFKTKGSAPTKAEIIAVGMAAEYLLNSNNVKLTDKDSVNFYIDSYETIDYLSNKENNELFKNTRDKRILLANDKITELTAKCPVTYKKVWAHSGRCSNGNYLADRLVKYALASSK